MNNLLQNLLTVPVALAENAADKGNIATQTGDQVQNLVNNFILSIPMWITGFIVIIFSFVLAKIVKSSVENKMSEEGLEEEHKEIQIVASRAASTTVLIIGITVGLKIAGIDLTAVIAAAAFGIGFAMQDIIMNFLAGIILLLQKQFTIGDWIKVNGTEGVVKEIQSRYTVIKKWDGTKAIIPNSELFKNQVVNLTGNPERRFQIDLGVDLYADLKEVIDLVYKSIDKVDKILKHPKPSIIVTQPGTFYNNLRIRCWINSRKGFLSAQSSLVRQIHKDFYRKGWSWPYPTQTLIFDKDVAPDVNNRAKEYIESHKKSAKAALPAQAAVQPVTMLQTPDQIPNLGIVSTTPAPQAPEPAQVNTPAPAPAAATVSAEVPKWLQDASADPSSVASPLATPPPMGALPVDTQVQ